MSYSKLTVENFGKIEKAEIEFSDLLLFIGDNNSGKSYLMTLIYGFANYSENIIDFLFGDENFLYNLEDYKNVENIINKHLNHNIKYPMNGILEMSNIQKLDKEYFLSFDELKLFIKLFNLLLNKYKKNILKFLFNSSENFIDFKCINFDINTKGFNVFIENKSKCNIFYKGFTNIYKNMGDLNYNSHLKLIIRDICLELLNYVFRGNLKKVFLPTSRTGFFLSYKELAKQSVTSAFSIEEIKMKTLFQKPISDFINNLIDLSKDYKENKKYKFIIKMFHDMIQGDIEVNTETGGYYYRPNDTDLKIPMYLNSAVITETAPLYLFLKYKNNIGNIFIEEPEMSLHLKLQKQIARIIINLVNEDLNLIISTHSDTILEHINNMIKLHYLNDKNNFFEKYSYTKNDTIDIEKIRIYQFNTDKNNITNIIPLEGNKENGFYIETFHNYINKAFNEYEDINESIQMMF